jgi:hypothetical protein
MSTVDFPDVIPSSMEFVAPEFPIGEDVSIGGVYTRRRFSNRASEGRLQVEFRNVDNSVAAAILAAHNRSKGTASIVFSPNFFSGAGSGLTNYLDNSAYPGLAWFFVKGSPPRIVRVEGGGRISNVSLELAARLVVS